MYIYCYFLYVQVLSYISIYIYVCVYVCAYVYIYGYMCVYTGHWHNGYRGRSGFNLWSSHTKDSKNGT